MFLNLPKDFLSVVRLSATAFVMGGVLSIATVQAQTNASSMEPDLVTYVNSKQMGAAPVKVVEEATEQLLAELKRYSHLGPTAKIQKANQLVKDVLGPAVDFTLIARRVMGRYHQSATPEQRVRFAKAFERSLVNTYALGLASYTNEKIIIMPFDGIRTKGSRDRATVIMKVYYKDGDVTPIQYALYKNRSGDWLLENLVLNGVNLGSTFRTQFSEAVVDNKGNLDRVIDDWITKPII